MKKVLFLLIAVSLSIFTTAQTDSISTCSLPCSNGWGQYAGVSLSVTNSFANKAAFNQSSFASVEVGITKQNLAIGLGVGKENLAGGKVYIEPKMSVVLVESGLARGYFTLGAGCIMNEQETFFIEYGAGVLFKMCSRADLALQYSNWAGTNYVSTGVNFNF